MARRLSFKEFKAAVTNRTLPIYKIEDYVQLDPKSPVPKLIFKSDSLTDSYPKSYDLDYEIYLLTQYYKEEEAKKRDAFFLYRGRKIVAEGDSWFNLPPLIRPTAIADRIWWNGTHNIKNIAYWGDTIKKILDKKQYLYTIEKHRADYFLLSAGGNDLQIGLAQLEYLHEYDPNRLLSNYLTNIGKQGLNEITDSYRKILKEVTSKFPNIKILLHGYDYPRPLVGEGKYIGQFLRRKGFPDSVMSSIIEPIIEELNNRIYSVSLEFNNVNYLNLLTITSDYTWYDDMHPSSDGFIALTDVFEENIL